jgi:hypothetical protein
VKQINSDQIVDNDIPDNTVKSIPRDLGDVKSTSSGKSGLGFTNSGGDPVIEIGSSPSIGSPANQKTLPATPSLIGIKSQTVKIKDDGTYAIDVVINVEDIAGVSDYEVRISKGAGSI